MVGGYDLHIGPVAQLGGVIADPGDHIGAGRAGQGRKAFCQTCGPDLGPAAATERLFGQGEGQRRDYRLGRLGLRHGWVIAEFRHELAVDAVFQPP